MSFALEAILFNLPSGLHYSGDSNPLTAFLPEFEMGYDVIKQKAKLGYPTAFKYDYSAPNSSDIFDDDIPVLSDVDFFVEGLPF